MSRFGLSNPAETEPRETQPADDLSSRLSNFRSTAPRRIDTVAVDAAAAPHGFTSREPSVPAKRRRIPKEETRSMGIRITRADYARFQAFADQHRVGYQQALVMLLDIAEGNR